MKLICCASECIHDLKTGDPYFDRKIEVKGYGLCPRCGNKTPITLFEHIDVVNNNKQYKSQRETIIPKCESCGYITKIVYTQFIVSKHRKSRHYYYHAECYERMLL